MSSRCYGPHLRVKLVGEAQARRRRPDYTARHAQDRRVAQSRELAQLFGGGQLGVGKTSLSPTSKRPADRAFAVDSPHSLNVSTK